MKHFDEGYCGSCKPRRWRRNNILLGVLYMVNEILDFISRRFEGYSN